MKGAFMACLYALAIGAAFAEEPRIARIEQAAEPTLAANVHVGGRALIESTERRQPAYLYQWPGVYFETVLWATDGADGEIREEVEKLVANLQAAGERKVSFIPVDGLEMTACHWHPSLSDHLKIANVLTDFIDQRPELWRGR